MITVKDARNIIRNIIVLPPDCKFTIGTACNDDVTASIVGGASDTLYYGKAIGEQANNTVDTRNFSLYFRFGKNLAVADEYAQNIAEKLYEYRDGIGYYIEGESPSMACLGVDESKNYEFIYDLKIVKKRT